MPIAKPDSTVLHRISFSKKEREMIETLVLGQTVKNTFVPIAIVTGVGAASYIGYKAANAFFDWGVDIVDEVQDLIHTEVGEANVPIIEAVVGKKTYTDKNGKTYKNPFAGIPVVGSLFGSGINIGIATNLFD